MDRFIGALDAERDDDLCICAGRGVAWQADMTVRAAYDESYFDKCAGYEGSAIAHAINAGRIALVNKYVGGAALVLDVGVGSGEFIRRRPRTMGYDINPKAAAWLKGWNRWSEDFAAFEAFTFWDVIEHVPVPEDYFARIADGSWLFASIPVFRDLHAIRLSRHYRPGEHLYYWTLQGFMDWMGQHRFLPVEVQDYETKAGRDSILSFAFRKIGA